MPAIVEFPGPGGRARGLLAKPGELAPGALILHPAGLDHLGPFIGRVAEEGFVALAPDLTFGQQALREAGSIDTRTAVDVAAAAQGLLLGQSGLTGPKIGLVAFAEAVEVGVDLATRTPEFVGAVVLFPSRGMESDPSELPMPTEIRDVSFDPTDPDSVESAAAAWRDALAFLRASLNSAPEPER